ncbi:MAG: hypothetical protein AB7K08_07960 [Microbacteriaceae bacterium]|jgi:hypothetical protein
MADWTSARAVADELAATGVDPLDVQAAQAARTALVRRFVLDLLLIFGIVAVVAALGLMVFRAIRGDDPIGGNTLLIASAALLAVLVTVALRSFLPGRAQAYETAWESFVQRVWPGARKGDELGAERLRFVRRAASPSGDFPSTAPGRKA